MTMAFKPMTIRFSKDDFTLKKATTPQSRFKNQNVEPEFWRKKKLEEIYSKAFGEVVVNEKAERKVVLPYSKAVPAEKLDWPKKDDDNNIYAFKDELIGEHGVWGYFDKKSLFDPVKDVGFTAENFKSEWSDAITFMSGLIKIQKYPVKAASAAKDDKTSSDDKADTKKRTTKKKAEK